MTGTTICFANIKGGVGKTTLAINVAHVLATELSQRVLVVDMDPQINATTALLPFERIQGLRATHRSIYNFFDSVAESETGGFGGGVTLAPENVRPVNSGKGFDLILGSMDVAFLELRSIAPQPLRVDALGEGLEAIRARSNYDIIIIDTPPTPSDYLVASLKAADFFVVPSRHDMLSVQGLGLFYRLWDTLSRSHHFKIRAQPLGIVMTLAQNPRQEEDGRNAVKRVLHDLQEHGRGREIRSDFFDLFDGCLRSCALVAREQERQRLIMDLSRLRAGNAQDAIRNITRQVYRRIQQRP